MKFQAKNIAIFYKMKILMRFQRGQHLKINRKFFFSKLFYLIGNIIISPFSIFYGR